MMPRGRGTASRRGAESRREPHLGGELVALASDLADLPLAALVDLLAQEIVAAFGDSVLVVHAGGEAPRAPTADQHGVFHVDGAAADPGIFARDFDYLLLDGFAPEEVTADLQVTIDGRAPLPRTRGSPRTLVTVLIDDRLPTAPTLVGIPGPAIDGGVHFTPCPLRLDCDAVAARWRPGVALATFDDSIRDSLARWARAITGRRVGVALSGGGAWGFYHVVALRRLVAAGVPIDIIASASMGSAVGAYFSARGLPGLDQLIDFATRRLFNLDWMAAACTVSSAAMELAIRLELGAPYLEQLTPRFHPVATNLTDGHCLVATGGPLGLAVRASASAPGLWAPTLLGGRQYVDGSVCAQVPAGVLRQLGADLTLALNCYPYATRHHQPLLPGPVGRFLHALNPLARVEDMACSGSLMLHRNGDLEGVAADVFFALQHAALPLRGAVAFHRARELIRCAEADAVLAEKVELVAAHWQRLRRRRHPRSRLHLVPAPSEGTRAPLPATG